MPAFDSRADITIIGGNLFRKIATEARFKKKDFKKADKTDGPRHFIWRPYHVYPSVHKNECSGPASVVRGGMPPAQDHNVPRRSPEAAGRTEACSED